MKTLIITMKRTGLRYRNFILFYIIACAVTSVGLVFTNRLQGDMGEAALIGDADAIVWLLILITGITAVRAVFSALSTLLLARFSAKSGYNLRRHFVNHFLHTSFANVEKASGGESLSVYSNDAPAAGTFVSTGITDIISGLISFAASLTFLLIISPLYTMIMVAAFLGMMGLVIVLMIPMNKRTKKLSEQSAVFNSIVNDSLQNLSVIAAYSLDEVIEERYMTAYKKYLGSAKSVARASIPLVAVAFLALFGPMAVINVVMAYGVINGNMTVAEFIAFIATIMLVVGGISGVANGLGSMASLSARAKRLIDNTSGGTESLEQGETVDSGAPMTISFENVCFRYKEDLQPALDGISFNIKPGGRIAFAGGNGSGKSTVLKLLMGLYKPESGMISIGGIDAGKLAKERLRDIFAYVPQDSFLFPETIGENITMERHITDMPRLEKACKDAGILDFINTLPEKFNSILTESSENISGGQRQRIAMARAFYKNAPVILFDEATSSLDPNTEAAVINSLDNAAKNKTVIMVAHRARAIAACDTIIVMDGSRVSGIGNHTELLEANAVYRNLYERTESDV